MTYLARNKLVVISMVISLSGFLSTNVMAVEPMTEADLGSVSADIGYDVLDVYGAPAAGLVSEGGQTSNESSRDENESDEEASVQAEQYSEGESTQEFAANEIRSLEVDSEHKDSFIQAFGIDEKAFEEAISAGEGAVVRKTKFLTTNTTSEVIYNEEDVHHESELQADGSLKGYSDIHIEQFRFEKLQGNDIENSDAGNLFLTDFTARTRTHMIER